MIFNAQKLPEDAGTEEIAEAYNALVDKLTVVLANLDGDNFAEGIVTNEESGR